MLEKLPSGTNKQLGRSPNFSLDVQDKSWTPDKTGETYRLLMLKKLPSGTDKMLY
jgi:hypothetical protein